MKTHFALLLPLLPSITQGKHVNLRGSILQDEPKSTRRLLDCISFNDAFGYFGTIAENSLGIHCRSNTECTKPGDKCLIESNGLRYFCGNPSVWDQDYPLCDEEAYTPTTPPPPPPPTTSPPPPPPTTSTPTTPPLTPPPVNDDNRDDDTCLPFDEAFDYYIAYIEPEDARGVNCRSNTECPDGQSCLVAMDFTRFFCGIPNDQDYVLCDDEIRTEPTEPQPSPTSPPPPPTTSPPTTPPPTPPPVNDDNRDETCLPFDEAYVYYYTYIEPEDARGVNCRSNTECPDGQWCLVAMDFARIFCGIPNDQDYVLCDEDRTDPVPTEPRPVPTDPQPSPPPPTPSPPSPSPPTTPRECISFEAAYGYYGEIAENALGIHCTSNTDCPGQSCLVESNGFEFFCGDPDVYDQAMPLCDE